jgi:hypothetical protein
VNKQEAIQKVQEILGFEPTVVGGNADFTLNGVWLASVNGPDDSPGVNYRCGGVSVNHTDLDRLFSDHLGERVAFARRCGEVEVPEGSLTLTSFEYSPGGKWDCGSLRLEADTPLGKLVWDEVVPGPRHGEDHHELTVTLNGHEVNDDFLDFPDFEPPGKDGKWADAFAESEAEVRALLACWYDENKRELAVLTKYANVS